MKAVAPSNERRIAEPPGRLSNKPNVKLKPVGSVVDMQLGKAVVSA
jgi:hypothetical protein